MEVLVIGGLAAAGWYLQGKNAATSPPVPNNPTIVPAKLPEGAEPSTSHQWTEPLKRYDTERQERWTKAHFPERTGVIAPFYTDVRRQHTNEAQKQRKMEQFTGSDITWKPKREQEALFAPAPQQIDSSGKAGNTPNYDADKYRLSLTQVQSNALPFEREQVGRGVGYDPDVKAADGFHPMLRVIPPSGELHKHRELTNTVATTGGSRPGLGERAVIGAMPYTRPPRVWDMSRRPLEKGRAQEITAPMVRGEHTSVSPHCHVDGEHRTGTAVRYGHALSPVTAGAYKNTRDADRSESVPAANVRGPDATGGYVNAHFDKDTFDKLDREQRGQVMGVKFYQQGTPAFYQQDAPQETTRNINRPNNGPGNVEPVVRGQTDYCAGLQLLKESKRSHYEESRYTPGPARTEAYRQANLGIGADPYVKTQHRLRQEHERAQNRIVSHMGSSAARRISTTQNVGAMTVPQKKQPEDNPRLDFTLASNAMQGNPYTVKNRPVPGNRRH
jgi:hypothetical protein